MEWYPYPHSATYECCPQAYALHRSSQIHEKTNRWRPSQGLWSNPSRKTSGHQEIKRSWENYRINRRTTLRQKHKVHQANGRNHNPHWRGSCNYYQADNFWHGGSSGKLRLRAKKLAQKLSILSQTWLSRSLWVSLAISQERIMHRDIPRGRQPRSTITAASEGRHLHHGSRGDGQVRNTCQARSLRV